jgi:hypothetical protein
MVEPPSLVGADHVADIVLSEADAERLVTALGTVIGVTAADIDEYCPGPIVFTAATLK